MVARYFSLLLALAVTAGAAQSEESISMVDAMGNAVMLDQPARRIISLAPNITELLFLIGAGEQIVGADEYSNYPEQAKQILRVSNYAAANYELMLSLQPDLVIAWQTGSGEQVLQRIRELGFPLFVVEPRQLDDIPALLRKLGPLSGHQSTAEQQAQTFERRLDKLRQQHRHQAPVSVFYQIWNEPLITLNGEHLVSDVLSLCGATNVFADAGPLVPYVNIESVLAAQPQVIIASGSSEDSPLWLDMWRDWPALPAVKNGHVYFIPPDLMQRHSMRILDGAEQVCQFVHSARQP